MKKLCIMIFILAVFLPLHSQAADIFIRQNKPAAPIETPNTSNDYPQAEAIPETLPSAPIEQPVPESTPATIQDFSKRYYQNCMKQNHPVLKGQTLQMMCSCTAAKVENSMTVEQMNRMKENTQEGQFERNNMLLFVYAPCIEHPTRALILDQCLNNAQLKSTLKNQGQTCGCLGDGMASYMKDKAPAAIQEALSRNINNFDPLRTLLESQEFNTAQQQMLQACVLKHELKQ